jgi:hypothetical protein
VASVLRGLGYEVLEATGPSDALKIAESESRIDFILSDLMRPEMQGTELGPADILIEVPAVSWSIFAPPFIAIAHFFRPSSSLAAATTRSGSNPKCLWSSLSGAEAPNVFMPMIRPDVPTYRSHPRVEASSTAIRACTLG